MDNQELHYSVASVPQSSFSIMAPTATYGVSPGAAIISLSMDNLKENKGHAQNYYFRLT
jgi:hypothetical protein